MEETINESLYSAAKDVMISSRRRESKKEHDLCKGEEMRIRQFDLGETHNQESLYQGISLCALKLDYRKYRFLYRYPQDNYK